ncbi:hypothetical protein [Nocardiopsis rhodophaea]|uniref:hypothetical protein n=1 Tax=Nocardiopsis rhodophaea TaxID=280238 RepID=UPI0031E1CDAD
MRGPRSPPHRWPDTAWWAPLLLDLGGIQHGSVGIGLLVFRLPPTTIDTTGISATLTERLRTADVRALPAYAPILGRPTYLDVCAAG